MFFLSFFFFFRNGGAQNGLLALWSSGHSMQSQGPCKASTLIPLLSLQTPLPWFSLSKQESQGQLERLGSISLADPKSQVQSQVLDVPQEPLGGPWPSQIWLAKSAHWRMDCLTPGEISPVIHSRAPEQSMRLNKLFKQGAMLENNQESKH